MINLRKSRIDDHWRRTYRREYPLQINQVCCANSDIFNDIDINLQQGINAIVGKNGIGKSNFVRALFNCFSNENSNRTQFKSFINNGDFRIDVNINDVSSSQRVKPNDETNGIENIVSLIFDPCNLIPAIQDLFSSQDNLEELLESFSSKEIDDNGLKLINYLTNTEYQKVEIINIEDEFDAFPVLPYFHVETKNAKYDSRTMGLGELSLFYFYWLFEYIGKIESTCLLIIEEPESFLPPLVQERFSDILAMIADTKGITILISTHSEHLLKRIPRSHIHIMRRSPDNVKFFSASSDLKQLSILGLTSPKEGILLYEDHAAGLFIRSLLKKSSRFVVDSFFFHKSGSDGDIVQDLKRFPNKMENIFSLAIFDGDCKGKFNHLLTENMNYCFLPSDRSPEEVLIEYLHTTDISKVSEFLSVNVDNLIAAMEVAQGRDHHDYFHDLSNILEESYDTIVSKLCDLWVTDENNINDAGAFISELESFG